MLMVTPMMSSTTVISSSPRRVPVIPFTMPFFPTFLPKRSFSSASPSLSPWSRQSPSCSSRCGLSSSKVAQQLFPGMRFNGSSTSMMCLFPIPP